MLHFFALQFCLGHKFLHFLALSIDTTEHVLKFVSLEALVLVLELLDRSIVFCEVVLDEAKFFNLDLLLFQLCLQQGVGQRGNVFVHDWLV